MKSMTGFGRAEGVVDDTHFVVEIKSVNHRFMDIRARMPSALSLWEIQLGELVRARFERGSFEISVRTRLLGSRGTVRGASHFLVDELALKSLVESLERSSVIAGVPLKLTPELLVQSGRVLIAVDEEKNGDGWKMFRSIVEEALSALDKMRLEEGDRLRTTLEEGTKGLKKLLVPMRKEAKSQPDQIASKLATRLKSFKLDGIDSNRLEIEVALLADKADVTEELDRLGHHLEAFEVALKSKSPAGRRLDFLLQEFNREVNTLGAKAASQPLSELSLEAKVVIEKLREQVQNVE